MLLFYYSPNAQIIIISNFHVADPSHKLTAVQVSVSLSNTSDPIVLNINLPAVNWAGGATLMDF